MPWLALAVCGLALILTACRSVSPQEAHQHPVAFSVITLNLYHDKDDWPSRRVEILTTLRALQPDVIALQEVLQTPALTNQAHDLGAALGYEVHFFSADAPDSARRYGNAILSRQQVIERGGTRLQPLDDFRVAAHVRVLKDGRVIDVHATHLRSGDSDAATRTQQVADLLDYVQRTSGEVPAIIAGDFNADPASPELAALKKNYVDTYGALHPDHSRHSHAHVTLNPAYFDAATRIDHVYARRGVFTVEDARILFDQPIAAGGWASDHFGVLVKLRLGDTTPPR